MKAHTVAEVVAAEAGGKTRTDRLHAMMDVFSAMYNRSVLTGKPLKDVVSVKSQFNAYNSVMPAGTPSYVSLAQQAIDAVMANGPTHKGTYYARSYATKNLPKGLTKVKSAVDDHVYYSDPKNRAIETATGAKKPSKTNNLPQTASVPQSRPNTLAAASSRTRSMFDQAAQGVRFTSNFPSRPNTLGRPTTVARSFTPAGPLSNDVYTPAGGYTGQGYADPLSVAAAGEWGRKQAETVDPNNPPSVDQQMADRQTWQGEAKARKTAESVVTKARDFASTVGDTLGGFFDSLAAPQTAQAAIDPGQFNHATPKVDRLQKTMTVDEALTPHQVKTTTVAAPVQFDERKQAIEEARLATALPMDLAVPPAPSVLPQTLARPRTQRVRKPLEVTVTAPRRQVDTTMPGGTLGGITAGDRFSVGSGLQGITSAMGGLRGATGFSRSNPGVSVTSRGPNLGTITRNDKFGTTTFRDASGSVTGVHYDGGFGSRLGHTLGGIFGGGGSGSGSSSGGKSSGGGGRSRSGGSLGGSTHSSDSVT